MVTVIGTQRVVEMGFPPERLRAYVDVDNRARVKQDPVLERCNT
jgi:hypothetical protein